MKPGFSRTFASAPLLLAAAIIFCSAFGAVQSAAAQAAAPGATASKTPSRGIEPVFPDENPNLVFVEAEDAVSTNFAREPVLNFGVSGFRALQLNRGAGLAGASSFYAEYVLNVPSGGTWELWYGGTPPGPRDELYASYASPFSVSVDAGRPRAVAREDVSVVESYTPGFYWNRVGDLAIDAGRHTLRFDVTEKRRADARYVLYLDCFFLVKKEGGRRQAGAPVPAVFPKNMDDKSLDTQFPSIDDALIRIRDNPGSVDPLLEAARLYSMLGDYLNALKYLNRAAVLQPRDAAIGLLAAKNRIWKGDLAEGLKKYWDVLGLDPKRRELWLEAGKVAAWNGSYDESISFFRDALAVFPGDLDLTVNLGLTLLWSGKGQDAETTFRAAQALAGTDPVQLMDLARVYRVNGYPDRAAQALAAAVNAAPQSLEARLLLIDQLAAQGRKQDADAARKAIVDTFVPSDRLTSLLDAFQEKEGMKSQALAADEDKLRQNPDNLVLRQTLAQSYFWNGMRDKAVNEYRHIIANYQYSALMDAEGRGGVTPVMDRSYVLRDYLARAPLMARQALQELEARVSQLSQAGAAREAAQKVLAAAQAAQARAKPGKETDAASAAVRAAEDKVAAAEEALQKAGDAAGAALLSAQELGGQFDKVRQLRAADAEMVKDLAAKDADAEAAFARQTASSRWTLDHARALEELSRDTADNDLARVVYAKISLADGLAVRAQAALVPDSGSRASSSAAYTYGQSFLWGGRMREAAGAFSRLLDDPGNATTPGGFKDLAALVASLESPPKPPEGAPPVPDLAAARQGITADLTAASRDAGTLQAALVKDLAVLHALYRHEIARSLYAAEIQVASIRNELGDYSLAKVPPALDDAIVQYRHVLAVDPGDIDATFRLGKVYEWNRDWRSAEDAYRIVWQADPYFENVATLFNHLAREHADTVTTMTSALADTHQMDWHTEVSYSRPFDSTFGLTAAYKADVLRLQSTMSGIPDNSSYQVHDVSVGVPVNLYLVNATFTPVLGGLFHGNGLFQQGGSGTIADYFESYSALPYARVDGGLGAWNLLFLTGSVRWGPQVETLDPARGTVLFDASTEANLSTVLSSVDVPVIRDTTLRTYGKVDLVHTGGLAYQNLLYTALQEVTVNVLKGGSPYTLLSMTGNVTWQNSAAIEPFLYWSPDSIFLAGGSITASTWIAAGGGSVLGLSLRAYGGSYLERAFEPGTIHRFKAEGEADVSYTSGNAAWTLTVLGNGTYNFDTPSWDYWSIFLKLGCTVKLPQLLAP